MGRFARQQFGLTDDPAAKSVPQALTARICPIHRPVCPLPCTPIVSHTCLDKGTTTTTKTQLESGISPILEGVGVFYKNGIRIISTHSER